MGKSHYEFCSEVWAFPTKTCYFPSQIWTFPTKVRCFFLNYRLSPSKHATSPVKYEQSHQNMLFPKGSSNAKGIPFPKGSLRGGEESLGPSGQNSKLNTFSEPEMV